MHEQELKEWVAGAMWKVVAEQPELWTLGVGEQAIVAQVFAELKATCPSDWTVDSEYEREGLQGNRKFADPDRTKAATSTNLARGTKSTKGTARPDIIVHHRGSDGWTHNLLVVEFKKIGQPPKAGSADHRKVQTLMSRFGYQFGAVVGLTDKSGGPVFNWLWLPSPLSSPVVEPVVHPSPV